MDHVSGALATLIVALGICPAVAQVADTIQLSEEVPVGLETVVEGSQQHTALIDLFGKVQVITYARVGNNAFVGGDTSLGTHEDVQRQSVAKLLGLLAGSDRSVLQREDLRMLLTELAAQLDEDPDVRAAIASGTQLWPSSRVPYFITGGITDPATRGRITQAIDHWNANSVVQLQPAGNTEREILRFEDAEGAGWNCYARLGFTRGDGGYVRINPECTSGAILHEIGHALGLMHEHSRPDRDLFLNVAEFARDGPNYGVYATLQYATRYDPCSIMHYAPAQTLARHGPWFALSSTGQQRFAECSQSLPSNCRNVGQRCTLSADDELAVQKLYGARSGVR